MSEQPLTKNSIRKLKRTGLEQAMFHRLNTIGMDHNEVFIQIPMMQYNICL